MPMRSRVLTLTATSIALAVLLSGCSSSSDSASRATTSTAAATTPASRAPATEGSTFGEPTGLWEIPRDVQVAYFKAICTAPGTKFGYAGTFNEATGKCLTSSGMESDVDFVMRKFLASDADQMLQSTQFMIAQIGVPVEGCPTLEEYSTVVGLTVTNECVVAALQAMTTYLSN